MLTVSTVTDAFVLLTLQLSPSVVKKLALKNRAAVPANSVGNGIFHINLLQRVSSFVIFVANNFEEFGTLNQQRCNEDSQ